MHRGRAAYSFGERTCRTATGERLPFADTPLRHDSGTYIRIGDSKGLDRGRGIGMKEQKGRAIDRVGQRTGQD
jgi:hypothetical protein